MAELITQKLSDNLGMQILNVDLADLSDEDFESIRHQWQKDPLLLFRRQSLTENELLAFSRCFGALDEHTIKDFHDDANVEFQHPQLLFISNLLFPDGRKVGGLSNSEVVWHTDLIYRSQPASGSIFYGVEMPEDTGETSFCNMVRAYQTLPAKLKKRIEALKARCKLFNTTPLSSLLKQDIDGGYQFEPKSETGAKAMDERTPEVVHDLVLKNPATGERSLYLSPNHTTGIVGMDMDSARELFDTLLIHALHTSNIYSHRWRNGDVVLWDNARLLHRREAFASHTPRLAKRTTVHMDPKYFAVAHGVLSDDVATAC